MHVQLAPEAVEDLVQIWDYVYLSSESPEAADGLVRQLSRRCHQLADAPHVGRLRPEIEPGLRSVPFGMYLIFYRESETFLEVARIMHGMRDVPARFGRH